ncbi:unnamed protein product [Clonostachys byssicola]|uniref:NmrA-like domain-containing protein n=1 Tax=Clonostachys byssicola TaxID=160290 RepID=A0A9N9XWB8_9HYPO|nr:unnamed protein product [Clonostachys byssicola]
MASPLKILILGGAGAQNSYVARDLARAGHSVSILTRDPSSEQAKSLSKLQNIKVLEGDAYDEKTLIQGFKDIDAVFVNTNGFAIGEKSEIYWGIRIYELAYMSGVKHFIYSSLPYVSKKGGYDPKYRVPFVDGKAKVVEYLKSQPTDRMNWSILESGPYADFFLFKELPVRNADGVYVFTIAIGEQGSMALVSLDDLAWFARHMFENPEKFRGDELSVGIEHASGQMIADAFTSVTGKPAAFVAKTREHNQKELPEFKLGTAHSPGFEDPTLVTMREMFVPWWGIWEESIGNTGLWTRDYSRLDAIKPDRIRTVEEWMRAVGYNENLQPRDILKTGLTSG